MGDGSHYSTLMACAMNHLEACPTKRGVDLQQVHAAGKGTGIKPDPTGCPSALLQNDPARRITDDQLQWTVSQWAFQVEHIAIRVREHTDARLSNLVHRGRP